MRQMDKVLKGNLLSVMLQTILGDRYEFETVDHRNDDGTFSGDTDEFLQIGKWRFLGEDKNWSCGWYILPSQFDKQIGSRFDRYRDRKYDRKFVVLCGVKMTDSLREECKKRGIKIFHSDEAIEGPDDFHILEEIAEEIVKWIEGIFGIGFFGMSGKAVAKMDGEETQKKWASMIEMEKEMRK